VTTGTERTERGEAAHRPTPWWQARVPVSSVLHWFWNKRAVESLTADERQGLIDAQVAATRPIVSGVIVSGAVILGLVGLFEANGLAPGIGYPWWAVELVAIAVAGCALAIRQLADWRPRLLLTVVSTLLVGVFLSIPAPGVTAQLALRTALFQLMPIALLAMMARPASTLSMLAVMLGLAVVRVAMHGDPGSGGALYWLHIVTAMGFGLLIGGFRIDFAVATFRMRQRLRQQAQTDELTGLRNRTGWNRDANECYQSAMSRGQPASIAFLDIDRFKAINDTHGHEAGDRVLQSLGGIIRERLVFPCCGARLGGEEFVVLMTGQAPDQVEGFVQRVRQEFAEANAGLAVTVSAGTAHRQAGESMSHLMRRADLALYEAKAHGRDRMVVSRA
jgi:diguanylate cyclase (GGDEF)-like protein